ncbi:MAG: ribulose-phosphate 3-epimerase [Solirubrobacteraceae bacterium]
MSDPQLLRSHQVAPSVLAASFDQLGAQVTSVLQAGARVIHIDVMDGHFVPPISFGAIVVEALAEQVHGAGAILDVHLMIERPERQLTAFLEAGADNITVHAEATPHLHYALQTIREGGASAGAAICPATPIGALSDVAASGVLDVALCMTVNPGWGNQRLIESSYAKLRALRAALGPEIAVEADGGVHLGTAKPVAQAGANLLVAGSAVFGDADPGAGFRRLSATAWPRG